MDNVNSGLTDEELVKLVSSGDTEKFGVLMERYQAKLFRYGKKFLVDNDNIEDVVQDVFI
jgi:DNA-directed RNA polymerase specialized sigma24 family protein